MLTTSKKLAWLAGLLATCAIAAVGIGLVGWPTAQPPGTLKASPSPADDERTPVKTVRPRRDPAFRVSVQQLATVEPFYQANLRTRVAGVVRYVTKDIGDRVVQGELLAELDVPDLEQEVLQKESVVEQRRRELDVARTLIKHHAALIDLAQANIEQKRTDVKQAAAAREYRTRRLARFRQLATRQAISADVVDEQEQAALSATAAEESALVAVRKALADLNEKEASMESALADIRLKESLVAVAQKDLERTQALAGYARITAPFAGVITRRNVDPGVFVQNATTGSSEAILSVSRTDIVTVAVKLPDNAAPFITRHTEVEIAIDELPGVPVTGTVTRFAPAIEAGDRTMRVEVDLFNGPESDYGRLIGTMVAGRMGMIGVRTPFDVLTAFLAGDRACQCDHKGVGDALPSRPNLPPGRRLVPGMTGYVRLHLDRLTDAYLVPSSAVYTQGGKPYILLVHDGVSRQAAVKVQVNDGRLAKVALISRAADTRSGGRELAEELTGAEEVIVSRQLEVGDGQAVRATLQEW